MIIQWYPGHMTKSRRMMQEQIALVDIVIELLDARIPLSSRNPDIDQLAQNKRRLVILNKADLADPDVTKEWETHYRSMGLRVLSVNSLEGKLANILYAESQNLMREKIRREMQRGRKQVNMRAMVVGIPNVGKSTFINRIAGSASAVTGDRPGVTRGKQWIKVAKDFDLLDTPGVLWPKFEDESVGQKIAFTGAINDTILDIITLSEAFIAWMMEKKPELIISRYKISEDMQNEIPRHVLEAIAMARGFKLKGDTLDLERTANTLLDEFRAGRLGRITLESP